MEFVFALAVFLIAVAGLGAGLMLAGRPLKGSCGGLACVGGGACDGCPRRNSESGEENDA